MLQLICQPRVQSSQNSTGLKMPFPSSWPVSRWVSEESPPRPGTLVPHHTGTSISCLSVLKTWQLVMRDRQIETQRKEGERYRDRGSQRQHEMVSNRRLSGALSWAWRPIALATFYHPETSHWGLATLKVGDDTWCEHQGGGICRDRLRGCPLPANTGEEVKFSCRHVTGQSSIPRAEHSHRMSLPGKNNNSNKKVVSPPYLFPVVCLSPLLLFSNLNLNLWDSS